MKLTTDVVTAIGFRDISRPNSKLNKTYCLEHKGLILFLDHHFLGQPGVADLWVFEKQEVETVADIFAVCVEIEK